MHKSLDVYILRIEHEETQKKQTVWYTALYTSRKHFRMIVGLLKRDFSIDNTTESLSLRWDYQHTYVRIFIDFRCTFKKLLINRFC